MVEVGVVGRFDEQQRIDGWLDEARTWSPRTIVVSGPPGVGKTLMLDELQRRATAKGFRTVSATCHEDTGVPYLALAQLLRPLVKGVPISESDRRALAAIVDPLASIERPDDPERTRLGIFLAMTDVVRESARQGGLVLAVDDVQWIDEASAAALSHLAASVARQGAGGNLPLVVAVTSRPEAERDAIARFIDRLQQEPNARSIRLQGLDAIELHEFVQRLCGARPSPDTATRLVDLTRGIPLTLRHVVHDGLDLGAFSVEASTLVVADAERLTEIGPGVADHVQHQLRDVSDRGRSLLASAAVLGDGQRLDTLSHVTGLGDDFGLVLNEAVGAEILEIDRGHYRFAHPELRHALLHDIGTSRRRALHATIAGHLGRSPESDDQAAAAHHYREAGDFADRERAADVCSRAGDRAFAAGAWIDAARHFETTAGATDEPSLRARLHLQAGTAYSWGGALPEAEEHLQRAIGLAQETDHVEVWGEAVLALLSARTTQDASTLGTLIDVGPAHVFLDKTAGRAPGWAARVHRNLAEAHFTAFDLTGGHDHAMRARTLAEEVGDDRVLGDVEFAIALQSLAALEMDAARRSFAAAAERFRAVSDLLWESSAQGRLALIDLLAGDPGSAFQGADRVATVERERGYHAELTLMAALMTQAAVVNGTFTYAEWLASEAVQLFHHTEYGFAAPVVFPAIAAARAFRGDAVGAAESLEAWKRVGPRGIWRYEHLVDSITGDPDDVRRRLSYRAWTPIRNDQVNFFTAAAAAAQVELADLLDDDDLAASGREQLERLDRAGVVFTPGWPFFIPRLLGVARARTRDPDGAQEALNRAQAVATDVQAAGEAARVDLSLAELGLTDEIGDTAATAAARFAELGMLPFAARARRIAAPAASASSVNARVIFASDLVDSTGLIVRGGDDTYVDLVRELNGIVRRRLREHGGAEFKHTGDGIYAWFRSEPEAVGCALRIRDDLRRASEGHPAFPLVLRIGLAGGDAVPEGDDLFGMTVVRAARLCDRATGGRVLLSEEVARAVGNRPAPLTPLGPMELKGLPEPVAVWEAAGAR